MEHATHAMIVYPVRVPTPLIRAALDAERLGYVGVAYRPSLTTDDLVVVLPGDTVPTEDVLSRYDRAVDGVLRTLSRRGRLVGDRREIVAARAASGRPQPPPPAALPPPAEEGQEFPALPAATTGDRT